jgi:hypothetical protein
MVAMKIKELSDKVAHVDKKLAALAPEQFEKGQLVKSMAKLEVKLELAPKLASQHVERLNEYFARAVVKLDKGKLAKKDVHILGGWAVHTLTLLPGDPIDALGVWGKPSTTDGDT